MSNVIGEDSVFVAKLATIEPFGVMSLAPCLKRDGHQVALLEAEDPDLPGKVRGWRPDVVGYSVCTGSEAYYLALNRALKTHASFYAVFGGPHGTFFPEVIREPGVDAVCRGEGELAFAEFCQRLQASGHPRAVPNFSVKDGLTVRSLPPA
jgi:anaerobic magnesium-protoporphyrin IX monomethyl ester cyclase